MHTRSCVPCLARARTGRASFGLARRGDRVRGEGRSRCASAAPPYGTEVPNNWQLPLLRPRVTIGVHVHNAVESKSEISFRQIHKPTDRRVNYQKTVSGVGVVENGDIVKSYEVDKDQYVLLEPEEIDAIKLESKRTIDLVQFVDAKDIDYRYFERPYFLVPGDQMALAISRSRLPL
jgi:Ku70/Ku80 beta-barrel domain